jgi:phenylacetate-CoA ligase
VLGEEIFGEYFRSYVASCLGLELDQPRGGRILSSFGVGELGLHLCYETPATVAVRRAAWRNQCIARDLFGVSHAGIAVPMVLAFNPERTFIEIAEPGAGGYGRLTLSMLDAQLPIPLLRYQPGDIARLLDADSVIEALNRHGVHVPADMPSNLIALQGRAKEALPTGSHVGIYKEALYADHTVAKQLTGAFRIIASGNNCEMHVQLVPSFSATGELECRLLEAIPRQMRPVRLTVWPYERFPFGMTLDYERKFQYFIPAEQQLLPECGRDFSNVLQS